MSNTNNNGQTCENINDNEIQILLAGTCIHETIDQYKQSSKEIDISWNDKELNGLIETWKGSVYKGDESKWQKRIEWDNLSVNDAYAALASIDFSKTTTPEWYHILNKVRIYTGNIRNNPAHRYIEGIADKLAFGHIWIGACDWSIGYLLNNLSEEQQKFIDNTIIRSASIHLIKKLALISQKASLRLFNAIRPKELVFIRMNQANTNDSLDNSKHYYNKFVETQVNNGLENLLYEYPGLGRLIGLTIIQWERSCHEIISRVHSDRLEIADYFSLPRDFRLIDIQLELGDCHNNGRSVTLLTLKSGNHLEKLVYKPRSIEMESAYASFIQSINSTDPVGKTKALKNLKSLKRNEYGYIEFLESTKTQNNTDLSEFYFNAGRIAAVLYLLGCTDCHYENFIAADNQLHLIDAETIMEPLLRNQLTSNDNESSGALAQLTDSVLRLGMLPGCWLDIGKSKQHVEISCLATNVIDVIQEHKQLVDINTDAMHYQTKRTIKKSLNSSPYKIGQENKLHDFVKEFNEGLEFQLTNFSSNKAYYQKRLQMFEGIVRRLVPRPTQTYGTLLRGLYKPRNQSSAFNMSTTLECL
jgi:type 2 lantibiotic biosynthesis protein LanM